MGDTGGHRHRKRDASDRRGVVHLRNRENAERHLVLTVEQLPGGDTTAHDVVLAAGEERSLRVDSAPIRRELIAVRVRTDEHAAMVEYDPASRSAPAVVVRPTTVVVVPGDPT